GRRGAPVFFGGKRHRCRLPRVFRYGGSPQDISPVRLLLRSTIALPQRGHAGGAAGSTGTGTGTSAGTGIGFADPAVALACAGAACTSRIIRSKASPPISSM